MTPMDALIRRIRSNAGTVTGCNHAEAICLCNRVAELEEALRPFAVMPDEDLPCGERERRKYLDARRVLGMDQEVEL